jgi:hypothetical protein
MTRRAVVNAWELRRRELLKSLGVGAACLPLLRAGVAKGAGPSKKFVCVLLTEGYVQSAWKPKTGPLVGQVLPPSSAKLQPHAADVVFLPDMTNPFYPDPGGNHAHGAYGTIFYGQTARNTGEYREPNGPTLDQIIASGLPKSTGGRPTLALQVQVDRPPTSGGPGAMRSFWRGANQPINPEPDPVATYKDLFAGGGSGAASGADGIAVKKLLLENKSLLDYVGKSLEKFGKRLAPDDRMTVDGHLQSIRDLEAQLVTVPPAAGAGCGNDQIALINVDDGQAYPLILKAHFDVMVAALKCGVTQVTTLQCGDATGKSVNFHFVPGIPATGTGYKTPYRNWHDLAHTPILGGVNHKQIVDQWWMDRFADLIQKMKDTPDPAGGSLLSNSVVLWANHMQEGANHASQKVPWLLAGQGGGGLKTGLCIDSAGKPINDAMTDICKVMGVQTSAFGGKSMPGLTA